MTNGAFGNVPCNFWVACIEVRKKGAIGLFHQHYVVTRAEPRDITRYVFDELEFQGLEPRAILWVGEVKRNAPI